eukprot:3644786-Prymnesium_polylepis.2
MSPVFVQGGCNPLVPVRGGLGACLNVAPACSLGPRPPLALGAGGTGGNGGGGDGEGGEGGGSHGGGGGGGDGGGC